MAKRSVELVDIKKGIETCLDNGKRLFDDAYLLHENSRYRSAIPLYIFAYEEFGKASFLFLRFVRKQPVRKSELERLLSGRGAHLIKIMLDYERVSKVMYGMGQKGFQSMQEFAAKYNLPAFRMDYDTAIKYHEMTYRIVHRFHDIKMAFLYADYHNKWQTQNTFQEGDLRAMCRYLHGHVLRPFLAIKSSMFLLSLGVPFDASTMTEEQAQQFFQNPFVIQLKELYERYETAEWYNTTSHGRAALESVDLRPRY